MKADSLNILEQPTAEAVHFGDAELATAIRRRVGLQIFEVRDPGTSAADVFDALAIAFDFPEEFGHNWDALVDSLRDLEREPAMTSFVLLVRDAERFWLQAPRVAAELVETWLSVAEYWRDDGVPFHLVFIW
ncbi:MAG TPA: barstar family protein [Thermoanaerobaculia bacterium]